MQDTAHAQECIHAQQGYEGRRSSPGHLASPRGQQSNRAPQMPCRVSLAHGGQLSGSEQPGPPRPAPTLHVASHMTTPCVVPQVCTWFSPCANPPTRLGMFLPADTSYPPLMLQIGIAASRDVHIAKRPVMLAQMMQPTPMTLPLCRKCPAAAHPSTNCALSGALERGKESIPMSRSDQQLGAPLPHSSPLTQSANG
jgi:hypothetical protein